jgi:hypothetical protein
MPKVGKERFPYTREGLKRAKEKSEETGKPVKSKPVKYKKPKNKKPTRKTKTKKKK